MSLPICCQRPLCCHSSAGWNEGINTSGPLVWLLSSWFRKLPAGRDVHFDVIPVDTVARGLIAVLAAALRDEAEDVYQLGSGHTNPLLFERALDLTALGVRRIHGKPDATPLNRLLIKHLDSVAREGEEDPFPSMETMRWGAQKVRGWLKSLKTEGRIPPGAHRRWGKRVDDELKRLSMGFR